MSTIATPPFQPPKAPTPNASSAWNRGPPSSTSHPNSGTNTPQSSATPPNGVNGNHGNGVASGHQPIPISGSGGPGGSGSGHSRKGSLMVGGGTELKRSSIAFGTVDSPNNMLSSSPAAPSMTGTHLANNDVKTFGSIDADPNADPNAIIPPSRKSTLNASTSSSTMSPPPQPGAAKPELNIHAFFGKDSTRRQSINANGVNGAQLRPPQPQPNMQPRSPTMAQQVPNYGNFRPQQAMMSPQNAPMRPNGSMMQHMQPGMQQQQRPMNMGYGMPSQQQQQQQYMMQYGNQYYPQQFYEQQQYPQQWAPSQHPHNPQNVMRGHPVQASPIPQPASIANSSGGPSPVPTPPSRPPTLIHGQTPSSTSIPSMPSTPSRPMMPPSGSFSHQSQNSFSMSGGATAFTPRTSKAIKISRPDGIEVDLKEVASAAKPVIEPTPQAPPVTPAKKQYGLPVVVRLESEEQKQARLKEEAERKKRKEIEEKEEEERKARKERQAKEAEEKRLADEKAKADADEQRKMQEALVAEQAAAEKLREEKEAKAKAEAEQEQQAKAAAEKEAAEAHASAEAAREKADAERKALLTPSPSVDPSPHVSPRLAGADLPAKPKPSPLEIRSPAISEEPISALTTAKPIEDLSTITYPSSTKPPTAGLNSEPGKFRYDRDFLMQFMSVCKEKPEGLPPLEEIGLEPGAVSDFGVRRGSRQTPARGPPAGLGIGGVGRPAMAGMGSFGTGQFGSGNIRGTTSDERYKRSLSEARMSVNRQPSGGFPQMMPPMTSSTSRSGTARSQRGSRRAPQPAFHDPDVAPLAVSANSWVKAKPVDNDVTSPGYVERKVKALLNKLTAEKFDSISNQVLEWANKSKDETDGMSLKLVIKQIFEKATDEAHWSEMYARLCRKLMEKLDPNVTEVVNGAPSSGGTLFRKYLIGRCQTDFESGWAAREEAVNAAAAKDKEDKERLAKAEQDKVEGKDSEPAMLSEEYYIAQKIKRRGLGLVQLIGELYKLDMLSTKVIRGCLVRLVGNVVDPDEEDIESTCKLLTTVGYQLQQQGGSSIGEVLARLQIIAGLDNMPSRIRFMIMDIFDLQKAGWQSKKTASTVMTIAEIHQQAAKEQAQKAAQAAQASRESISRGGSRAGRPRDTHDWQAPTQPTRVPQRPTDMSGLGKMNSSGLSSAPSFTGPASVFSKRGKANNTSPSMSRNPSTTNVNQFSALDQAESSSSAAVPEAPQRPKITLAPRTKPMEGDQQEADGEGEGEEEEAEADAELEAEAAGPMTEFAAKAKIDTDMKEFWGEKDQGGSRNPDDVVEYFKSLDEERRPLLAKRLVDDVFRIAKFKDAEVVGKAWEVALEQNAVAIEILRQDLETRMPSLDDDSIDFPQAYKAVALLMRAISLPEEEISNLISKVDVFEGARVTPKDKFDKAFAQLEES